MRHRVLACDYDRTIALNGVVSQTARRLLRDVRQSGRRLVLITGRTLDELLDVFDDLPLFDLIVLENGGVLRRPDGSEELLGPPVATALTDALAARDVEPLVVGRVMCSTAAPNRSEVVAALHDAGAHMEVVLNRDSIMVLPPGVHKGTGLHTALRVLQEPAEACVAVGDGENDIRLLRAAGVGVAVENAVPELKATADMVLTAPGVQGLEQLTRSLVADDLAALLAGEARAR